MAIYERCEKVNDGVKDLAKEVLEQFETHKPLLDAKVKIDFLFASPEEDENGNPTGDAITLRGFKVLGVTRQTTLKDRAKGLGDAEVIIDREWWDEDGRTDKQKRALLDHELHHLDVRKDDENAFLRDSCGRPKLRMRKHDVELGWFKIVASRHGEHSLERKQAAALLENDGQYFWPSMLKLAGEKAEKSKAA